MTQAPCVSPLQLELACLEAWPAAVRETRHGWVRQASGGRSLRVNSVWTLDWTSEVALEDAIAEAAAWQRAQGGAPSFKLADGAFAPDALPETLSRLGYRPTHETLVMVGPAAGCAASGRAMLQARADARIWAPLRESAPSVEDFEERRGVVERIGAPHMFARAMLDGREAGVGLGVPSGDLIGLYLMRTAPWARRRGLARDIVSALLAWGADSGARTAYLQVEADNAPAVTLYQASGFSVSYSYRYWAAP